WYHLRRTQTVVQSVVARVSVRAGVLQIETLRSQLSTEPSLAKSWQHKYIELEENMLANNRELEQIIKKQVDRIDQLQMEKRQLPDNLDEEAALREISKNKCSDEKLIKNLLIKFRTLKKCTKRLNVRVKTCENRLAECITVKEQNAQLANTLESCMQMLKEQKLQNHWLTEEFCRSVYLRMLAKYMQIE
ncbi:hypothetical protein D918_10187, partial [Trichuris suis]